MAPPRTRNQVGATGNPRGRGVNTGGRVTPAGAVSAGKGAPKLPAWATPGGLSNSGSSAPGGHSRQGGGGAHSRQPAPSQVPS